MATVCTALVLHQRACVSVMTLLYYGIKCVSLGIPVFFCLHLPGVCLCVCVSCDSRAEGTDVWRMGSLPSWQSFNDMRIAAVVSRHVNLFSENNRWEEDDDCVSCINETVSNI